VIVAGKAWQGADLRPVVNPWSGAVIDQVAYGDAAQLEEAVAAAAAAAPVMRAASRAERSAWCEAIARGLEEDLEGFAQVMMAESGKPIRFARDEVRRAITTFRVASQEALRFGGQVVPLDVTAATAGYQGMTQRFGCGPVAAITPFNFPLNLVAHKVAPALAVGNPVLLKPAPNTPLTSLRLGQLVINCGIPAGGFSCLNLDIPEIESLCDDARVPVISFTGSAKVGWALKARAPRKRVILELGGNATAIVHNDANLEYAASRLAVGGYSYSGQVCISVQHILVEQSVYAPFRDLYTKAVEALPVGDPALPDTIVGPLIRAGEVTRVQSWIEEAVAAGATPLLRGQAVGSVLSPTLLENVPSHVQLGCQEVFGPVTTLAAYHHLEEALAQVNASPYGLQTGLFTRDIERILHSFEQLEVGALIVNDFPTFRVDNMPYGGVKDSGVGREGVLYTMEEMSEPRLLVLNRNPLQ
jgi:acyl-CoA reductase-like NAD-dependent aldehyde dehydrogenase